MKKLFGGINFTWKKLIVFAIITGIYTAIMALIPITKETSFRDIAIQFEWWILFGIIIIANSKSPLDSALKCFVFFLISQPLIYLIQVPFSDLGFGLFNYYKYWFMWTLCTFPMGFIGYYINKKNWLSVIILFPMLLLLAYLGTGYLTAAIDHFPHHLLSFIACFAIIIFVVFNLFDQLKYKLASLGGVVLAIVAYSIFTGGIFSSEYETYRVLENYDVHPKGEMMVSFYSGTKRGNVEVVTNTEEIHTVKINGRKNGKYSFTIIDEEEKEYSFEYYYDEEEKTVALKKVENN